MTNIQIAVVLVAIIVFVAIAVERLASSRVVPTEATPHTWEVMSYQPMPTCPMMDGERLGTIIRVTEDVPASYPMELTMIRGEIMRCGKLNPPIGSRWRMWLLNTGEWVAEP